MIVTPEKGMQKEVGQLLLALADNPRDVRWVSWPLPGGYEVPLDLFLRFEAGLNELAKAGVETTGSVPVSDATPVDVTPKRRGRPPKVKEPVEGAEDKEE